MLNFTRTTNAFNYVFEKELEGAETVIVKMPTISPNKRGINDIGWQTDGDVTLYATLNSNPKDAGAMWQEIKENETINKTVFAIKIVNNGGACNIAIRAILN
ncbi:MAG: hypothetical protein M0R40_00675 [Firmicutes bacterium]|nr:hypothetical protein [Bacillota bacterium]